MEHAIVINGTGGSIQTRNLRAIDPALIREAFQTDQDGVSSKRRSGRVGGVPVAQRAKWQHLPDTLPRRRKEVDERIGRRAEISHPPMRRQRSGMKQNTSGTRKRHEAAYIPCSLPLRLSALSSSSFRRILPAFVIWSTTLLTNSPKRSCCFCCSNWSRI